MTKITEEERIRLENKSLRTLIGKVASFSAEERPETKDRLKEIVGRAREILSEIKKRKRSPKPEDLLEKTAQWVKVKCTARGIVGALIIIERLDAWKYEAFIDDHDDDIGVGHGATATEAVQDLYALVKIKD